MHAFLAALRAIVGDDQLLTRGDLSAYERDWRGRAQGKALAVARPAHTAEVAAIVQLCQQHRVSMVAQGGNTGLVQGGIPDASGAQLLISLQRLRAIRRLDSANQTITVEAGCTLHGVHEAAAAATLRFPLDMASAGSCTIGGTLSTNAGGTQVLRYGTARALCLGLEVVSAQGEVLDLLRGLRKNNMGYDLKQLYIGSEGTLGIITAATLRLVAATARATALVALPSLAAAVRLLSRLQRLSADNLTGFELIGASARRLVAQHYPEIAQPVAAAPWTVLVESSSSTEQLSDWLQVAWDDCAIADAAIAQHATQAQAFWSLREAIPMAQQRAGGNLKHDVAVPISAIADFVVAADAALHAALPGIELVVFGHAGDGNLHYNVQGPVGVESSTFIATHEAAVQRIVYDLVDAHGGAISAEHGIGGIKQQELAARLGPVAIGLMHQLKQTLDPLNLMNPGRVLAN